MTDTGGRNHTRDIRREADAVAAAPVGAATQAGHLPPCDDSETPASEGQETVLTLSRSASVALTSLAPKFKQDQHDTYLQRLNAAVKDDKNRNIALTGRYGAGKSSVLDEFDQTTGAATLRLAISSLGPNEKGVSLTNRIQKDLVKQLVYSAAPATLRHSRFIRSIALSWKRAALEASVVVLVVGGVLAMLGWLPPVAGTGPDHHGGVRVLSWLVLSGLLVVMATVIRQVTHDRFQVAEVSAGGATISLSKPEHTYFDEYLDDIVHYFDNEDVDIVIFEDLDRFDDPHIFEALRELNTLLNKTNKRQGRTPLRFVYAVRDSLFELIGNETTTRPSDDPQSSAQGDPQTDGGAGPMSASTTELGDLATAEAIRANRTKFFDVVIPIVPFISHRNARELLDDLLTDAGIGGIERPLVSVIARHATDMRLLLNIRNEYLVFAERLLESQKVAPGLTASNLFALIGYKNFHLADFENIARQASVLDLLYDCRRELVRSNIERLEREKRVLATDRKRERARAPLAARLSQRLKVASLLARAASNYRQWSHLTWKVGTEQFDIEDLNEYQFWAAVADTASIQVVAAQSATVAGQVAYTFNEDELKGLLPEALEAGTWADIDNRLVASRVAEVDQSITFLRGASFRDLASTSNLKLSVIRATDGSLRLPNAEHVSSETDGEAEELTFRQLVLETMRSQLGCDLVLRGYLDRNFALYAAQFYGHFTGVDVANFIVQNVQTNTMEVDYQFDGPESVANLLNEADDDFLQTVSAYNIDVLSYLLDKDDPRAVTIIHQVADDPDNPDAKTFLTAYMTSSTARREQFVAHLTAKPWRNIFKHLAENPDIPEDARPSLFSAALCSAKEPQNYDLSTAVADYIADHYPEMAAFSDPNAGGSAAAVGILAGAGVQLPTIHTLQGDLLDLVVAGNHYALTASNLHIAVGDTQAADTHNHTDAYKYADASADHRDPEDVGVAELSLDRLREHKDVYRYILANPDEYLAAVDDDSQTPTTVRTAAALRAALNDVDAMDTWGDEHVRGLVDGSFPTSRLDDLTTVPASTWQALAAADRFRATLKNVEAYRAEIGIIDEPLGRLLELAGEIDTSDGPESTDGDELDRLAATYAVLNTSAIAAASDRVKLAVSVGAPKPLPVAKVDADSGDLLAPLLQAGLVEDDADTFKHFHGSGWSAIGPGVQESTNFAEFVTPDLVDGMVADVLRDSSASRKVGRHIVENAASFVPDNDTAALRETGRYAQANGIVLPVETIHRVVTAADNEHDQRVVLKLLRDTSPAASTENVVEVFRKLGNPYDQVARPGATFDLVKDDLHEALLNRLDGRVEFRKRTNREIYKVTVL